MGSGLGRADARGGASEQRERLAFVGRENVHGAEKLAGESARRGRVEHRTGAFFAREPERGGDGVERPGLAPHRVEQAVRAGVAPGGPRELAEVQRVASRRGHDRLVLAHGAGGCDQRE